MQRAEASELVVAALADGGRMTIEQLSLACQLRYVTVQQALWKLRGADIATSERHGRARIHRLKTEEEREQERERRRCPLAQVWTGVREVGCG